MTNPTNDRRAKLLSKLEELSFEYIYPVGTRRRAVDALLEYIGDDEIAERFRNIKAMHRAQSFDNFETMIREILFAIGVFFRIIVVAFFVFSVFYGILIWAGYEFE